MAKIAALKCSMAFASALAVLPQTTFAQTIPTAPAPEGACTNITVDRPFFDGFHQGLKDGLATYGINANVEFNTHAGNQSYNCGQQVGYFCQVEGTEAYLSQFLNHEQRVAMPQDLLGRVVVDQMDNCLNSWAPRLAPFR